MRTVFIGLTGAVALVLSSCSMLAIDPPPSKIVIPETDARVTESPASSLAPTTASRSLEADDGELPPWSYERVIKAAPRSSNSRFQTGAASASGERSEVSGYHFSTEDRGVRCSTGNNGADALVCVGTDVKGPKKRPATEDGACDWKADYVVLDGNGAKAGACANSYPVLFRSQILGSGKSITIDRFACLSDNDDLYCIDSASGAGFAVTSAGFKEIKAEDRAPRSLLGLAPQSPSSTPNTSDSSPVVPTD